MSEMNHEKEKKIPPLYDDCSGCKERYQITANNSAAYHYEKQSECDFLLCVCPNCNFKTRIFINEHTMGIVRDNAIPVLEHEPYADENIYSDWLELNEIELPNTYELTDRHEETVRKFGETLINMPNELFWDNIEAEQPRPYPERWI